MGQTKKKRHRFYIPWYTSDADLYEEEEGQEDSWVSYIRRNLQHPVGEESPFPDSSWSYTRNDSPFSSDNEDPDKKSDLELHHDVSEALYQQTTIDASKIRTLVLNGIVCLFGSVESEGSRLEVETLVRNIPGVWSVRNELTVEKEQKRSLSH